MNILIIGSGGREDAFAWKFQHEENVRRIFVSPGHGAMERFSKVSVVGKKSQQELVNFAKENDVELTVVGPEAPLTEGIKDLFAEHGLSLFGPDQKSSRLEGSKIFSKEFMKRHDIPSATFEVYESYDEALKGLKEWNVEERGIVIKADGLAGGKGVVVTYDRDEAEKTLYDFMIEPQVSVKSDRILFEEVLLGEEVSAFALCKGNGDDFFFLGCACDHKRVFDHDKGPNTGGMGCFHTPYWPDSSLVEKIKERVLKRTLKGCQEEGMPFCGFLFMGLMIDKDANPFVIEYNVRMGDPETQTLFPLIQGSLSQALLSFCGPNHYQGDDQENLRLKEKSSVHVVATSAGYPSIDHSPMNLNNPIDFSKPSEASRDESILFLAAVTQNAEGKLFNTGGRVLGVTAIADSLEQARDLAYEEMDKISFEGMHYRRDIALKERGI